MNSPLVNPQFNESQVKEFNDFIHSIDPQVEPTLKPDDYDCSGGLYANLSGMEWVDRRVLTQLARVQGVTTINLSYSSVSDNDLELLLNHRSLEDVNLRGCNVSDYGVLTLKDSAGIRTAILSETGITDKGLAFLNNAKHLNFLEIEETSIHGEGFGGFPQLADIFIAAMWTRIDDKGLPYIAALKVNSLSLNLPYEGISDNGLSSLWSLDGKLKNIQVGGVGITDKGLEVLATMSNLKEVMIYNASITDHGVMRLAENKGIESVGVRDCGLISNDLSRLMSEQYGLVKFTKYD